ncbi:Gfo/Idh/MocA family protein [Bosea sp. PAMC 26642]|uniref:Gfo/Idh/MocA family protein n=1 Tax=Bosea sp. (strain PAMC 26642) TaxID=1792307 RepID=UPI0007700CBD|nr:Gfo/Idh/MocA family oxidoreductase [Bosea sp. PAMC 26642]AMJ61550.1 hypothetical protein AXW83_15665 [Bosea sp. PAMC 26642]
MTASTRIAIIGAGVIGKRHAAWLRRSPGCRIVAVADPSDDARRFCESEGLPWFANTADVWHERPDGVIVATPNVLHLQVGLECIANKKPMLMEKPVADTVEAATKLTAAAADANVPILIGHYRRHSPTIREARRIVQSGEIGKLVCLDMRLTFCKPDDYFKPEWRRVPGGGPVLINLIHDIDALRFIGGEIATVQASYANNTRGFPVEDTAAIIVGLENGALATILISDTVASPYSWDLNAAEEPAYPVYDRDVYLIGGSKASLALPNLTFWSYGETRGWTYPIETTDRSTGIHDPYMLQCAHFLQVVRGHELPLVTAVDGTKNQIVAEAIAESARSGRRLALKDRFAELDRAIGRS